METWLRVGNTVKSPSTSVDSTNHGLKIFGPKKKKKRIQRGAAKKQNLNLQVPATIYIAFSLHLHSICIEFGVISKLEMI